MFGILSTKFNLFISILKSFYFFIAIGFIILTIGIEIGLTFRLTSFFILILLLVQFFLFLRKFLKSTSKGLIKGELLILILFLAVISGFITSSINRPDIDDSVYCPKAVFYTENPNSILDNSITWIAGLPKYSSSPIFQHYEIIQASLAWLFGLKFLTVYHVIFPFIVGFLSFISVCLLLSLFHSNYRIYIAGAVTFVLLTILLGETHRSYGNVTIARAFHGKFVLFYLGFYSWAFFSLKFFNNFDVKQIPFLAFTGVALTVFSSTALVYIPFLSLVIFFSFFISNRNLFTWYSFKIGIGYFFSLLPTAVLGLIFREKAISFFPTGSKINSGFSSNFLGQLEYLVNSNFPVSPILFIISSILIIVFSKYRILFSLWIIIPLILLLNPYVSDFVITNITTENIYWRMFYLLPFPLIVILSICHFAEKTNNLKILFVFIFIISIIGVLFSPSSVFRQENNARFEIFSYKIKKPTKLFVETFTNNLTPGTCFCPIEISSNLVIYSSKFPQFYLRDDYQDLIVEKYVGVDNSKKRKLIGSYLYSNSSFSDVEGIFKELIFLSCPDYFVLNTFLPNTKEAGEFLASMGYTKIIFSKFEYQIWKKMS